MSDAYKCDRCGTYSDTSLKGELTLAVSGTVAFEESTFRSKRGYDDLCEQCVKEVAVTLFDYESKDVTMEDTR